MTRHFEPQRYLWIRLTTHAASAWLVGILASGLVIGCSKQETSASSMSPHNYLYAYDQLVGVVTQHTFLDLATCGITAKLNTTCVSVTQATLTVDECNQVKAMVTAESLATYHVDDYSRTVASDAGIADGGLLQTQLPDDASTGSVGEVNNTSGASDSTCVNLDAGTQPAYVRQVPSFVVRYVDAQGTNSKYVFWLDGRSFSAKTEGLIELIRSLHAKYAPR